MPAEVSDYMPITLVARSFLGNLSNLDCPGQKILMVTWQVWSDMTELQSASKFR